MAKRLAITISGAVSLGSYEAGVLYEVIAALGQHNQSPKTSPDDRIYIDVLTGASAGGMTATIAAQKLLYGAADLQDPERNAFYEPWVKRADLSALLQSRGLDDPLKSLLSSQLIVDISREFITGRYQGAPPSPAQRHPAAAETISLGLALSNLNGVGYSLPIQPGDQPFAYTEHQDQMIQVLDPSKPETDSAAVWEPIRNAAVSCGAFPVAFEPVSILRSKGDYSNPIAACFPAPSQPFAYTDGGTFDNEPLGMAKDLVDAIDQHLNGDTRFYLFVSPRGLSSGAEPGFRAEEATYLPFAKRLANAVLDQAQFQDLVNAEAMNDQIELFNDRANQLSALFKGDPAAAKPMEAAAVILLAALFKDPARLQASRVRLRAQFQREYAELGPDLRDCWIDAILVFETAADLWSRDEMKIYGITARTEELASCQMMSFAGFFDEQFRVHDYNLGRGHAQRFLEQVGGPGELGPINYTPAAAPKPNPELDGLTLERMEDTLRLRVREGLRQRAREVLKAAGVSSWVVRKLIDLFAIKPALNRALALDR